MGKGYLIDSNVIIGYLDNKIPEQGMNFMNKVVDDVPNISVISKISSSSFLVENYSFNYFGLKPIFI
jgi:hypothetical protein